MGGQLDEQLQIIQKQTEMASRWREPRFFAPEDRAFEELVASGKVRAVYDPIRNVITDLYDIAHPTEKDLPQKSQFTEFAAQFNDSYGSWVHFPWSASLVRFPTCEDLRAVRTSRNRNLITKDQQQTLYEATIAVVGLSVGSNVLDALTLSGIGGSLLIADADTLEPSNLNRIRVPYSEVGLSKLDAVAKKISEVDPYVRQQHFRDGLSEANLSEILQAKPHVIVDEMDDLRMKILLRQAAKEAGIAVVSAADDGDDTLIDIERYDVDRETPIFNGLIPDEVLHKILVSENTDRSALGVLIGKYFIGKEHIPLAMYQSLGEVGKTLPSWPQLGSAAVLAGVTVAYCARKIILGEPLASGRYVVGPDAVLNSQVDSEAYRLAIAPYYEMLDRVTVHD